ncbi:MAG: hypothetical protein ACE5JI_17555, partial [Acidobacteriota bacterium]
RRFSSTLFAFEATTGLGAFDLDPYQGGVQTQVSLGQSKVAGMYVAEGHLYVSKSGDQDTNAETDVWGGDEFGDSGGGGEVTIRVLVLGFRISPF